MLWYYLNRNFANMRFIGFLCIITTYCTLFGVTARHKAVGRIIGGQEANPHRHPFMVSLQIRFLSVRAHLCGGSLISRNWVLTAAQCINIWSLQILGLDAIAGLHDAVTLDDEAQIIEAVERIPNPRYKDGAVNDIGLVRTKYQFEFTKHVQPINLPTDSTIRVHSTLFLIGWGQIKPSLFYPIFPGKLQEVELKYMPYEECVDAFAKKIGKKYGERLVRERAQMCARSHTDQPTAACSGDSGSPLIQYVPKMKSFKETDVEIILEDESYGAVPVLIGVTSMGVSWGSCDLKLFPTVFTNVSNYKGFILKNTNVKLKEY